MTVPWLVRPWIWVTVPGMFSRLRLPTAALTMLLLSVAGAAAQSVVKADDPRVAYMGRYEAEGPRAVMGFPGVTVRFAFTGPAPTVRMTGDSPTCYFNLSVNGWDPVIVKLEKGPNRIALPTGPAPAGGWVVELVRRTESWMGTASFDGLELPAGCRLIPPPAWPQRKLMFIGDSLTCGEYDERFPMENDSTPRSTNAARSYAMLLARWLGAQVHLVAYGGRGLTRDWSGKVDVNTVPVCFERALPDKPGSTWDPQRYVPDVVVINDGTDFDGGPIDLDALTQAFTTFVTRVRTAYPRAFILLSESGFQSDGSDGSPRTSRDRLLKVLNTVVMRLGDPRIRVVHTGFFPGTPSNTHLVAFQQEQIALDLLQPIKEAAGW